MNKIRNVCLAALAALLLPMAANADIIMTITDDGTDLTMKATGTYDNSNLTIIGSTYLGVNAIVGPNQCCYGWETGQGNSVNYAASYSGLLTGTNNTFPTPADVITGTNPFFFWHTANRIVFQSSAPLSGTVNETAIFYGFTLASLGMVAGESITVTWGDNIGTIQTFAGPAQVPEPGTLALLGLGLAGVGFAKRKKA